MLRLLVILSKDSTIAFYGAILSAAAITALFFGQRIAKDYAGAAVLVPYFLLTLVAIYLLAQGLMSCEMASQSLELRRCRVSTELEKKTLCALLDRCLVRLSGSWFV